MIAYLEQDVWKFPSSSHVKNLSLIHTSLGLVISLLLVFRTNTAYERWWEGRKIWGSLVNSSRNLATKTSSLIPNENACFVAMTPNFSLALKNHLRDIHDEFELKQIDDFNPSLYTHNSHVPNKIAQLIIARIISLQKKGVLLPEYLIYLQSDLNNFTDSTDACERIRKTPIPFSYSVFLKKFIFIYVMTLPFGYMFLRGYWVIPVVALIFYVLASLELIAEEIEDPFGTDANDLPVDSICGAIHQSVNDI